MQNTQEILDELKQKYKNGEFRILGGNVKTIEIQNAHFICDKPWVVREPNYDYASREIQWYHSQSLNVNDIPGDCPKIWRDCADPDGFINSNYGWCIWSEENGYQYDHCIQTLVDDPMSRQGVMLYNRPSMQEEATKNGMHDFMCTYCVQCFLNLMHDDKYHLKYIVYMRSNDAVFGFDNDILWHEHVRDLMVEDLNARLDKEVVADLVEWNAGSFHVYERHFKFLE
jgi:thymidylate synthase